MAVSPLRWLWRAFLACTLLLVAIAGLLAGYYFLGRPGGGLGVPDTEALESGEVRVSGDVAADFQHLAASLWSSSRTIYGKPDLVLRAIPVGGGEARDYSIWQGEGFIYDGYFLDAWTERMSGRRSEVFMINRRMREYLGRHFSD